MRQRQKMLGEQKTSRMPSQTPLPKVRTTQKGWHKKFPSLCLRKRQYETQ